MSRKVLVITAFVICFSAIVTVLAQDITNIHDLVNNAGDYEAVRQLVYKEIEGWFNRDSEQVFSVFDADNMIGITAGSDDPSEWFVSVSGRSDVRAYADRAGKQMENLPEGFQHKAEVQHVHIKNSHAIAVARQWMVHPDNEKNRMANTDFQTVWMLRKINGRWKIVGWIGGVVVEREVTEN